MGLIEDLQIQLQTAKERFVRLQIESQSNNPVIANIAGRDVGQSAVNVFQLESQIFQIEQSESINIGETPTNNNLRNALIIGGVLLLL